MSSAAEVLTSLAETGFSAAFSSAGLAGFGFLFGNGIVNGNYIFILIGAVMIFFAYFSKFRFQT